MAEANRRELSFPLMPHGQISQELEDYLRQLEELLRTILFGIETPIFPDVKIDLEEGSVPFGSSSGGLDEDHDNFHYAILTKLLDVKYLSLGGTNGTIWYSWDGKLRPLLPSAQGMVLHDGGGSAPPYWDWIALRTSEIVITVIVSAAVVCTRHETYDEKSDQGVAAITSDNVNNNEVADAAWYSDQDYPELTAAETSAKVTMDGTSDQGAAAITIEIVTAVA